jgi:hypothetical protein
LSTPPILTPNVGLQVPDSYENDWGPPVNANWSLLDQLLSGNVPLPGLAVDGVLTGQTLPTDDNSNKVATTAYVQSQVLSPAFTNASNLTSGTVAEQGMMRKSFSVYFGGSEPNRALHLASKIGFSAT